MKYDLGVRAGKLLTMKDGKGEIHEDFFIGVNQGVISEVVRYQDAVARECTRFIGAKDKIVIPGLINGHTHMAMSLFRGFEDDVTFHDWVYKKIFPLEEKYVDAEFVKAGAELSALECIRFGTTTVNDLYFFPEVTAHVLDRSGMRGVVAQNFFDRVMVDEKHLGADAIPSREARFLKFYESYRNHARVRPALGPHAPYTCSDELYQWAAKLATKLDVPLHTHLCETIGEVEDSVRDFKKTPAQRLHDISFLSKRVIAAHGVHVSDAEIEIFKKTGISLVYNPDSNAKLGSGVAPITRYRREGLRVGLGTDGAASNNDLSLFGAMDMGTKLQKLTHRKNTEMVALDALNLATYEGARTLGLGDQVGSIEVGKRADLVLLETHHPHLQPLYSVLSQLVYAYQGLEVDTVICDGKVLLDHGQFKTLDSTKIYADVNRIREKIKSHEFT